MENKNGLEISIFNNKAKNTEMEKNLLFNEKVINLLKKEWNCTGFKVKNRFYFNNLVVATHWQEKDLAKWFEFYSKVCSSDVGIVFTEGFFDGKLSFNQSKYLKYNKTNSEIVSCYSEMLQKLHTYGTKIILTISPYAGRGLKPKGKRGCNYSASFNRNYTNANYLSARLSDGKINEIIEISSDIAEFSKVSGFDGVLVDCSSFNILGELSSTEFNRRTFGYYSETSETIVKIVERISEKIDNYPTFIKLTPLSVIGELFGNKYKNIKTLQKVINKKSEMNFIDFISLLVKKGADGFIFDFGTYETEFVSSFNEFASKEIFLGIYNEIRDQLSRMKIKNKFNEDIVLFYKDNFGDGNKILKAIEDEVFQSIDITRDVFSNQQILKSKKTQKIDNFCLKCCYCDRFARDYGRVKCAINPFISGYLIKPVNMKDLRPIAVVGAGISGMYAAALLAERGYTVDLYEQNETLNKTGECCSIFNFDSVYAENMNIFKQKVLKFAENNKINIFTKTKFLPKKEVFNNYSSIIIATGFKERFLTVVGAILKNVKSIYDILASKKDVENSSNIVILAKTELSLKFALYLLKEKKKVSVVIQNEDIFKKMPNAKMTYYAYSLFEKRAKVYMFARVKKIEEDSVELIVNSRLELKDSLSVILNSAANVKYSTLQMARTIDCDLFVYEPDIYPNNKLYYELIKNNYCGELFLIGNALEIGDLADDIHSAFFVANNI